MHVTDQAYCLRRVRAVRKVSCAEARDRHEKLVAQSVGAAKRSLTPR